MAGVFLWFFIDRVFRTRDVLALGMSSVRKQQLAGVQPISSFSSGLTRPDGAKPQWDYLELLELGCMGHFLKNLKILNMFSQIILL